MTTTKLNPNTNAIADSETTTVIEPAKKESSVNDKSLVAVTYLDGTTLSRADESPVIDAEPESATDGSIITLDSVVAKITPFDEKTFGRQPIDRDYILRTNERIADAAAAAGTTFVKNGGNARYFNGTHYTAINDDDLKNFLTDAALVCGVPSDIAVWSTTNRLHHENFLRTISRAKVSVPNASFINLQNGTLFFYKNGVRFEKHIRQRLITYVLPFAYSTAADCPLWHQHLDRSLPEPDKQAYLAKCLALAFYSGKIEKAPCFWGEPDTGKSVTLDIFKALLGRENFVTESLTALTQKGYHGDYARARLDGKLACVASDISKKLVMTGSLKLS